MTDSRDFTVRWLGQQFVMFTPLDDALAVHKAWRAHRALYRLSGGRFLWTTSNKRGWGALRLTTVGRRPGQERSVIIGYLEDGPNLIAMKRLGRRSSLVVAQARGTLRLRGLIVGAIGDVAT